MNEHDLIRFMGRFPDAINQPPWVAKKWKCSLCGDIVKHEHAIENPAPCKICGSIGFEPLEREGRESETISIIPGCK